MDNFVAENMGLILTIEPNEISDIHLGWAQGPQQIQIGDHRRVYFSTRFSDGEGYIYSGVHYVDFELDLTKQLSGISAPVIKRSSYGAFDEDGIFPFHPIQETHVKDLYFQAFACGWQRKQSVDIDMKVGLVETHDGGVTFTRMYPGPVMGCTPEEPFLIGDATTVKIDNNIFVYYIFGTDWISNDDGIPERVYKIGFARYLPSETEVIERKGIAIIPDRITSEAQAMPTVIIFEGVLHMFYCFRSIFNFRSGSADSYRLAHAFSNDGVNWTTTDSAFLAPASNWDSGMQCYPSAFVHKESIYVLYNGNDFGKLGFGCMKIEGKLLNEYTRL
jgi:hypothetical protein